MDNTSFIDEKLLVNIRRDFHQNPELGGYEIRTMNKICEYLDSWGIEYQKSIAETGVVAIVRGKKDGKTIGVRTDMDALPIKEETDISFKSLNEGIMHACGHDAHTTIALGTAKAIKSMENEFIGNVKFFFQPAEETTGGAERMINDGCLKNPDVDNVIGLHIDPNIETGKILIKYGKMMASSDEINITVKGKSTHGAHPHYGIDPVVIASHIIVALQSMVSRNISPLNSVVLTIGSIHGGTKRNIIPDEVNLEGILRTLDDDTRNFAKDRIKSIIENIATSLGGEAEISFRESYGALINDDSVVDIVKDNAKRILGKENVVIGELPNMGTEDFSYFAKEVKSCFFNLGCRKKKDTIYPIHSSKFKLDEKCLRIGVELQTANVLKLLGKY